MFLSSAKIQPSFHFIMLNIMLVAVLFGLFLTVVLESLLYWSIKWNANNQSRTAKNNYISRVFLLQYFGV